MSSTLHSLIWSSSSHATAICCFDQENVIYISYGELYRSANYICNKIHLLRRKLPSIPWKQQICVGIILSEQKTWIIAAMLGVLRSGNYFVILDPKDGSQFLKGSIDRLQPHIIISVKNNAPDFPNIVENDKLIDNNKQTCRIRFNKKLSVSLQFVTRNEGSVSINQSWLLLAYVMQTSGSTGPFKTVHVSHASIVPNITHLSKIFSITASDEIVLGSPFTFDPCIIEIFLALTNGASLLIHSEPSLLVAATAFLRILKRASFLQLTPSLFRFIPVQSWQAQLSPRLRVVAFGGEGPPSVRELKNVFGNRFNGSSPHESSSAAEVVDDFPSSSATVTKTDIPDLENSLRIFNLYGVTEMSCWASCTEILPEQNVETSIGNPLLETNLEISPDSELILTSDTRWCYISASSSTSAEPPCNTSKDNLVNATDTYRCRTGDVVSIRDDGRIYFSGRLDDQVKRHGKRINLASIEQLLTNKMSNVVSRCAVYLHNNLIYCFVQQHHQLESITDQYLEPTTHSSAGENIEDSILSFLKTALPNYSLPDIISVVSILPVNKHGKTDKQAILLIQDQKHETHRPLTNSQWVADDIRLNISSIIWKTCSVDKISDTVKLSSLGIDSLKAVQISMALEVMFNRVLPKCVDILITGTLHDIVSMVSAALKCQTDTTESTLLPTIECDNELSPSFNSSPLKIEKHWTWDSGKCIDASPLVVAADDMYSHTTVFIGSHSGNCASIQIRSGSMLWTRNLESRIEATAELSPCRKYVVVGTYDGSIFFLDRLTGATYWKFVTGDAVKAAPVTLPSGHDPSLNMVFICSYDRSMYCLDVSIKTPKWKVDLGAAVKATPCLSRSFEEIFVGTLGSDVLRIDTVTGTVLNSVALAKPIFGSPKLFTIDDDTQYEHDYIAVPCVDGCVCLLKASTLEIVGSLATTGPIFGAPLVISDQTDSVTVIIGSRTNDGIVHKYSVQHATSCEVSAPEVKHQKLSCSSARHLDTKLIWNTKLNCEIIASPVSWTTNDIAEENYCVVALKSGKIVIIEEIPDHQPTIIAEYQCPGEVFSTPAVFRDENEHGCTSFILVGCRDNLLYCLRNSK